MITLELNDEEALGLRNLLDIAVRSAGMRVAEFAIVLDRRILEAARKQQALQTNGSGRVVTEEIRNDSPVK